MTKKHALEALADVELALRDNTTALHCWLHSSDKPPQVRPFAEGDPRGLLCERSRKAIDQLAVLKSYLSAPQTVGDGPKSQDLSFDDYSQFKKETELQKEIERLGPLLEWLKDGDSRQAFIDLHAVIQAATQVPTLKARVRELEQQILNTNKGETK